MAEKKNTKTGSALKVRSRRRVFKPHKQYRYLVGDMPLTFLKKDLQAYNEHLKRMFDCKSSIDHGPPFMKSDEIANATKFGSWVKRLRDIENENRNLVRKINAINRTRGKTDCFNNYSEKREAKEHIYLSRIKAINQQNHALYDKIKSVKSQYDRIALNKEWNRILDIIKYNSKYPICIFKLKTADQELNEQPSISSGQHPNPGRPRAFLELKVENGIHLGRLTVDLYNDRVPVTVQNFLAICRGENGLTYKNCPFHKIYTDRYCITGDITSYNGKGGKSIYGDKFAEEISTLKHSRAGVLSMVRVGNNENNSQFSITFNKMEELDGRQVVFGKVVKGASVLYKIADFGRKFGKPVYKVMIVNCGEEEPPPKPKSAKKGRKKRKKKKRAFSYEFPEVPAEEAKPEDGAAQMDQQNGDGVAADLPAEAAVESANQAE